MSEPAAAWGASDKGSYINTLNPLSQMFQQTDRIPQSWVNLFPDTVGGHRAAHLTFKAGADALLAAGLIALYRGLSHVNRMSGLAKSDNPAHGMTSELSTTFAGSLDPKKQKKTAAQELEQPAPLSGTNVVATALPIGAILLATSLAYRATDDWLDSRRNAVLDDAIGNKENVLKRLIKTRSRLAKGNASDKEVAGALNSTKNEDLYVKQASVIDDIGRLGVNAMGLLGCLVLGASAIGSYYYFNKSDENNVRYRAMKKGLKEYARTKAGFTPVAIIPTKSRKFFEDIDAENPKKQKQESVQSVRQEQPVLTEAYNKPISLTL